MFFCCTLLLMSASHKPPEGAGEPIQILRRSKRTYQSTIGRFQPNFRVLQCLWMSDVEWKVRSVEVLKTWNYETVVVEASGRWIWESPRTSWEYCGDKGCGPVAKINMDIVWSVLNILAMRLHKEWYKHALKEVRED